ncbi:protocadherin Fat 4 isoform X1 [Microplitis demolitor]|uniref:protocadherin Fat 4 isoform X1 n=1 Tax=Microplitis demolitor TaxID=69319 RepID=UPI0004CD7692|nr:protocadherin Fat 4 isoform X1 [Microplitis demolitor]
MLKILFTLLFVLYISYGQIIRDTRCFLENGASASHLFVSEDKSVGDTIGVLGVLGDPGIDGDIELRLQERDSPVTILPHSRNLTLIKTLDKEGIDGPASVYITVICERRHTLDPVFSIPVNIRVTDANDNAPQFVNAPYILNISEVTVVGTRVLQGVRAVDIDQPGPYSIVQYSILPGPHSDYFFFINALEGTLVLKKPLDFETLNNFSVVIRAQDQGSPPQSSLTTLSVNVIDADDQNPVFSHDQYRVIIPDGFQNKKIILPVEPVPIKAVDQDIGINAPIKYTAQNGILPFLHLNSQTAEITLIRNLLDHELLTPSTIVIKATQVDNPDRFSLTTVIMSRKSSTNAIPTVDVKRPVKFILQDFTINVPENTPRGSVILSTGLNKVGSNLKYWLESIADENDKFSVSSVGEIILKEPLDYEKNIIHNFLIHVTDGINNDTARVHVAVEDINEWEPRFRHPRYEFHAHTLREGSIVGKVEAADGDRGDRVTLSLRGPDARNFQIRDNGELILTSSGPFNSTLARLVAVATDSGKPPRTSMIPLIVHVPSTRSNPIAARAAPAWLSGSIFLVAGFGVVLGLLGIVILILILYIYKQKRPKNEGLVNSIGTGYRGKSPVPSALNPSPQILGANVINDISEDSKKKSRSRNKNISNPVFGKDNQSLYNAAGALSTRHMPGYNRHKVAPLSVLPSLSATSNIPNIGDLVQNMNDLSTRANIDTVSQDSSNYSVDPPDSLIPVWPAEDSSRHVKKLSWNDDRIADNVTDDKIEQQNENNYQGPDKLNLTVYF